MTTRRNTLPVPEAALYADDRKAPARPAGSPTRTPTVWYWTGGTERGQWQHTLDHGSEVLGQMRRSGYVAYAGTIEIGPPDDAPTRKQLDRAMELDLFDHLRHPNRGA